VHVRRLFVGALAIGAAFTLGACGSQRTARRQSPVKSHSTIGLRARLTPWRLPFPVAGEVALAQRGRLLVIGGLDSSGASSDSILALDPHSGEVRDRGTLVQPTHDAAGAVLGGIAFIFGGGESSSYSGVEELTPGNPAGLIGSLPTARSDLAAATIAGRAYVIGGYDGTTLASEVLATSDGRRFHPVAQLRVPVRYPAVAAARSRLFVFGGETTSGQSTDVIQEVDPRAGRTRVVASLATAIDHAAAVAFGDRIYVLGGDVAGIASRQIVFFDPVTDRVRRVSKLPLAVADAAVVRSGAGAYLLGGLGTGQTPSSRAIRLTPGG
jgi:hypothetical protein